MLLTHSVSRLPTTSPPALRAPTWRPVMPFSLDTTVSMMPRRVGAQPYRLTQPPTLIPRSGAQVPLTAVRLGSTLKFP